MRNWGIEILIDVDYYASNFFAINFIPIRILDS